MHPTITLIKREEVEGGGGQALEETRFRYS